MANNIRKIRENQGFTLEQLADAAETSVQQVSRLERGERRLTVDWMARLAGPLGVEPAALLSNETPDRGRIIQEPKKIRLRPDEVRLIRWWRILDDSEKRMIAAFGRAKGLEILADQSDSRSA